MHFIDKGTLFQVVEPPRNKFEYLKMCGNIQGNKHKSHPPPSQTVLTPRFAAESEVRNATHLNPHVIRMWVLK